MKANELRLGNYVEIGCKITQVGEIFDSGITTELDKHQYEYIYLDVKSIPLTEEWLLKFGFNKYSHEPGHQLEGDEKEERCDEYSAGIISVMDWGNGFVLSNSFSFRLRVEIKYVHQLQNLYFALTGNELKIK